MQNGLAVGAAAVTTFALLWVLSAAATFGMDGSSSLSSIPGPLWLLFTLGAATLGACVFQVIRRR